MNHEYVFVWLHTFIVETWVDVGFFMVFHEANLALPRQMLRQFREDLDRQSLGWVCWVGWLVGCWLVVVGCGVVGCWLEVFFWVGEGG